MPDKIEMAKAYVQIVPSADGIRAALTDVFDEETDGLGAKVGQSIGAQLVGTIKKVLAAAGIGKIIKDSIDMGGALQQSIGGIETLFKDSADTVKQYAAQAYQTVGLSANDYMEQTTSFAASLLSSVSKDTNAAAQLANMAMVDMADNANKMGTDMQDIQNAYQGFAKQNYTMLDNLKLGYGGTQAEMQRLLIDAEKISGVHYDLGNLADMYSAIHVIQREMDIRHNGERSCNDPDRQLCGYEGSGAERVGQLEHRRRPDGTPAGTDGHGPDLPCGQPAAHDRQRAAGHPAGHLRPCARSGADRH